MSSQDLNLKDISSLGFKDKINPQDQFDTSVFGSYQVIVTKDCLEQYGEGFPFRLAEVVDVLNERLEAGVELPSSTLNIGGRGKIFFLLLPKGGNLILRFFLRGGFVSKFNKNLHFLPPGKGIEQTRPYREIAVLKYLHSLGINVPEPIAAVVDFVKKNLFYRGTIATIEILNTTNLLQLAQMPSDQLIEDQIVEVSFAAGLEARKVLDAGVLHRDLHLGNVLVDRDKKVYLIDFDRAAFENKPLIHPRYYDFIIERWKRSVVKQNCNLALEPFVAGLLKE